MKPFIALPKFLELYQHNLPKKCHMIGLDIGTKYMGVAISDHRYRKAIATEMHFTRSQLDKNIQRIRGDLDQLCLKEKVIGIVVGVPSVNESLTDSIIDFAKRLSQGDLSSHISTIPIILQDESYTSYEAYRQDHGVAEWKFMDRKELSIEEKKRIDCVSAAKILQRTLDDIYKMVRDHKRANSAPHSSNE